MSASWRTPYTQNGHYIRNNMENWWLTSGCRGCPISRQTQMIKIVPSVSCFFKTPKKISSVAGIASDGANCGDHLALPCHNVLSCSVQEFARVFGAGKRTSCQEHHPHSKLQWQCFFNNNNNNNTSSSSSSSKKKKKKKKNRSGTRTWTGRTTRTRRRTRKSIQISTTRKTKRTRRTRRSETKNKRNKGNKKKRTRTQKTTQRTKKNFRILQICISTESTVFVICRTGVIDLHLLLRLSLRYPWAHGAGTPMHLAWFYSANSSYAKRWMNVLAPFLQCEKHMAKDGTAAQTASLHLPHLTDYKFCKNHLWTSGDTPWNRCIAYPCLTLCLCWHTWTPTDSPQTHHDPIWSKLIQIDPSWSFCPSWWTSLSAASLSSAASSWVAYRRRLATSHDNL